MAPIDRRLFLGLGALTGTAIAGALAGCTPTTGTAEEPSGGSGESAGGGTLRAAFAGGGSAETLNYLQGPTSLDYVRARLVHGALGAIDPTQPDGVRYGVLEAIEISDDLATYTLRVRPGIVFTDGAPLTSADVLYSLRAPQTLQGLPFTQTVGRSFALDRATADDELTVTLPTASPIADGRLLLCPNLLAIQDGTTEFTPQTPSCGPFTITAFEPGQSTVLTRNPDYFGAAIGDEVSLDEIELLSISDGQARVTALEGGQADFASGIDPVTVQTLSSGDLAVTASKLPYASTLRFRMSRGFEPFQDARVRQAFRLAVDRRAIVDSVYFGRAYLGNDVPALGFPTYDTDLEQRSHDPDTARQLLEYAGMAGMAVELTVGPELAGMVETGTLIVEDLRAVGVGATLRELPAGQLFADYEAYLALPFAASYSPPALFEPNHVPGAFPEVDALVVTARSAAGEDERLAASHAAQRLLWADGDEIIPVFVPNIDVRTKAVEGVRDLQFPDLSVATIAA